MNISRLSKNNFFLKLITLMVMATLLWSNYIWANYSLPKHLASQSNVKEILLEAQIIGVGNSAVKSALDLSIKTNKDLCRDIKKHRNDFIKHQAVPRKFRNKIMWFVFADKSDPNKRAYYIFTGIGMYIRYTKDGEEVNDSFFKVLKQYGARLESEKTTIKKRVFNREIYQITEENLPFINSCLKIIYGEKAVKTSIKITANTGLIKDLKKKAESLWFPQLNEKRLLADKIEALGIKIKGWKSTSVEYLEDMLLILNNLKDNDRSSIKTITLIPWYRSILFWLGVGGRAELGKGNAKVVLMPTRSAFQWVFAHEIGHLVMNQNRNISNQIADNLWKIKGLRNLSLKEWIVLNLEFILPLFLAATFTILIFGFTIVLFSICFSMLLSYFSGNIYYKLIQRIKTGEIETLDYTRPWKLLHLERLENEAEGFAASVLCPRIKSSIFSGLYEIIKKTFKEEKLDSDLLELNRKSGHIIPARFFLFLSLIGHITILLYFYNPKLLWIFIFILVYFTYRISSSGTNYHLYHEVNKTSNVSNESKLNKLHLIKKILLNTLHLLLPVILIMMISSLSVNTKNAINSFVQETKGKETLLYKPIEPIEISLVELPKEAETGDAPDQISSPKNKWERFYPWGKGRSLVYSYSKLKSPTEPIMESKGPIPLTPSSTRNFDFATTTSIFIPKLFSNGRRAEAVKIDDVEEFIIHIKDAEPGWCNIFSGDLRRILIKKVRLKGGLQDIHIPASEIISRLGNSVGITGFDIDFGKYSWEDFDRANLNTQTIYLEVESTEVVPKDKTPTKTEGPGASLPRKVDDNEKEQKLLHADIDITGQVHDFKLVEEVKEYDLKRLKKIMGVDNLDEIKLLARGKIQNIINQIREKHTIGIFGTVKKVILVDNLGGIDSDFKDTKGGTAYLQNGTILIDIDALVNDNALYFVSEHEHYESILEIIEANKGLREVTATYLSLKTFAEASSDWQDELMKFLNEPNDGLESMEYRKLLDYIRSNGIKDKEQLIALAINYVLNTSRYSSLRKDLENIQGSDVEHAANRLELAKDVYEDLISAVTQWKPIIEGVQKSEGKLFAKIKKEEPINLRIEKAIKKLRDSYNYLSERINDAVNTLIKTGKYLMLDIDELAINRDLMEWIKSIDKNETCRFFYYSSSNRDIQGFLAHNGLRQSNQNWDNINEKDKIVLNYKSEKFKHDSLFFHLPYSRITIYMAMEVVLADGKIDQITNSTVKMNIISLYEALAGKELSNQEIEEFFRIPLPEIIKMSEILERLKDAILLVEKSA